MYKLLIVDDEEKARELIRESISWDALSISEVMESKDGLDAINKIEGFKPDIMILDIKMPKMDGIELLRLLNEKSYNIKTIISSGYNDFEYAKESYNMGIIDYILKPIQEDQLVEIISKCINAIEDENEQKNGLKVLNDNLVYYKQKLDEQVIFDYILGNECIAEDEALNEIDKGIEKAIVAVLVYDSDKVNTNDIKG